MNGKIPKILLHILYWLFQLGLSLFFLLINGGYDLSYVLTWILVSFPFKLIIFYSYFYFFIPNWLNDRTFRFILISLILLIGYPLLKIQLDNLFGIESLQAVLLQIEDVDSYNWSLELLRRSLTVILNIASAFVIRFAVDWFRNRQMASQMEKYRLQSELALLRNQVNPHFLFNTLNNIDSLVYKVSEEASDAIMKLSSIMRYMLYESTTPFVQLSKEVDYIHSYFDLERMRVKNKDQIRLTTQMENPMVKIAPMMFIPFVENAFKHATPTPVGIKVSGQIIESGGFIELTVINSFDSKIHRQKDQTGGIGLQNVKRRLELIYPKRHELIAETKEDQYILYLKLDLNEA